MTLQALGRHDEAVAEFARARELAEALVREQPGDPIYGHELIRTLGNLAGCLIDAGASTRRRRSSSEGGR